MNRIAAFKDKFSENFDEAAKDLQGHIDDCIKSTEGIKIIENILEKEKLAPNDYHKNTTEIAAQCQEVFDRNGFDGELSEATDDQTALRLTEIGGCTAVMVQIKGNKIWSINAGDSRAIMIKKDGTAVALSEDHKPDNTEERARIEAAGLTVMMGRVLGNLALSRSIGDFEQKCNDEIGWREQAVTAMPDVQCFDLTDVEQVVVACDGIWDMFSNQDCADFIKQQFDTIKTSDPTAKNSKVVGELFSECLKEKDGVKGTDNMTCIIVKIKSVADDTA